MYVKVQSFDDNVECQSCNSYVNDCMVAEVDASNDNDDDDDESIVSVVDNADQLLVDEDAIDCCVSDSDDHMADVVTIVIIHDDVGESEYANVDDGVLAEQLLLSGDNDGESGMSASVGRVVHRVCMSEASSGDVGAVVECATHAVVCDVDHVSCKHAVSAESGRNALHALRLVLVLLLLIIFAGGAVCAVLIELFANVWVPSKVISDNGTNFSSQLTQELLRRFGCSPVFATPWHPQATGLVQWFNRTCRDVLFRVVPQHGRRWSRGIPSARDVSAGLSKSVEAWMTDLRDRLKKAADWAELHARHSQDVNRHSDDGDQVIVLNDDAADKLCKRWQRPATGVRVMSPDSYHGLRGSASPVLTATGFVNGRWQFSTPPQNPHPLTDHQKICC